MLHTVRPESSTTTTFQGSGLPLTEEDQKVSVETEGVLTDIRTIHVYKVIATPSVSSANGGKEIEEISVSVRIDFLDFKHTKK